MPENNLKGTVLYSGIVPTNTSDVYPTHSAIYGMGGFRSVKTIAERDAIPVERLEVGAKVLVSEQETGYYVRSIAEDGTVTWELDTRLIADRLLPTPMMEGTWSFSNSLGEEVTADSLGITNVNSKVITIEKGYKASLAGRFKWTVTDYQTYKDPETCSGDLGTTLPSNGVFSEISNITGITENRIIKETISAKKKGLMISGNSVIKAEGLDSFSDQYEIKFRPRIYFGTVTSKTPSASDILALSGTKLLDESNSERITNITASGTQYYCYSYPKELGTLSMIVQNGGAAILEDFTRSEINIVSGSGISTSHYVYISKYKGAFQNVILDFKI